MQKYIVLFIFTIFFAGLSYYLLQTLNPFDLDKVNELIVSEQITVVEEFDSVVGELIQRGLVFQLLNTRNITLIAFSLSVSLISGFAFLHLLFDKIFLRKFYEEPSILNALRRGFFFGAAVISILIFKIFQADDSLSIMTIGLLVVVEIAITRMLSSFKLNKAIKPGDELEPGRSELDPAENKKKPQRKINLKQAFSKFRIRRKDLQKQDSPDNIGGDTEQQNHN